MTEMAKNKQFLHVEIDSQQKEEIRAAAGRAGQSMSSFIRSTALERARRILGTTK